MFKFKQNQTKRSYATELLMNFSISKLINIYFDGVRVIGSIIHHSNVTRIDAS